MLTSRQVAIVQLVHSHAPITGEQIAVRLGVSRPTLRSDLSILVMLGYLDAKPKVGYFIGKRSTSEAQMAENLKKMKVKDIQGIPVAIRDTATVNDAVVTLFTENVGSLMVTDLEGALIGVVSRKDLLKVTLGNPSAPTMPISLVMTRQPHIITVQAEESVLEAARKLIQHQVDSLPVVIALKTSDGLESLEPVGRITKTSITKVLLELTTTP